MTHLYLTDEFQTTVRIPDGDLPANTRPVALSSVEQMVTDGVLVDAKTIIGLLLARSYGARR
jgi:hypothetical protein